MPHGFEYVVRPFQSPGSQGRAVIPATPKGTRELAHLVWGGKGTMPSVRMLYPSTVVNTKREDLNERNRDSDAVRVEQEGKPENYVMVERARTVRLDKTETDSAANLSYNYYAADAEGHEEPPRLDPRLEPYRAQFTSPPQNTNTSGPSNVTWNLKN